MLNRLIMNSGASSFRRCVSRWGGLPKDWRHRTDQGRLDVVIKSGLSKEGDIQPLAEGVVWSESPIGGIVVPCSVLSATMRGKAYPVLFVGMEERSVYAGLKKWWDICNKTDGYSLIHYHQLQVPFQSQVTYKGEEAIDIEQLIKGLNSQELIQLMLKNEPKLDSMVTKYGGEINSEFNIEQLLGKNRWVVNGRINPGPDSHGAGLATRAGEVLCGIIVDMLENQLGIDRRHVWTTGIVSNNYQKPNITSQIKIPISEIDPKNPDMAIAIAQRIEEIDGWHREDPNRASTNKKGGLNGLYPVLFGQDLRALSVGLENTLKTSWHIDGDYMVGSFTGALHVAPRTSYLPVLNEVLGYYNKQTFTEVVATAYLLQNFAALKTLSTPTDYGGGIVRNHGEKFNEGLKMTGTK